jgi:hypothetical protein
MPELTPPPHEPMNDDTRARIAARLTDATGAPATGVRAHRWLAPIGAAAAVLLIASAAGWAAFAPDGASGPAAPAPSATTLVPSDMLSEPPSESASEFPTISPWPTSGMRASEPPTAPQGASCARTVARALPGGEQVVSWALPGGGAGVWVSGGDSVFCEFSGGVATMHRVRPLETAGELGPEELGFSSTFYRSTSEQKVSSFIAGGPLPEGVTGIDYTFPDGHTQSAVFRTDDTGRRWWAMGYVATERPLAGWETNLLNLDPVRVTIALSGVQEEVLLQWGRDECAQVNHGC